MAEHEKRLPRKKKKRMTAERAQRAPLHRDRQRQTREGTSHRQQRRRTLSLSFAFHLCV